VVRDQREKDIELQEEEGSLPIGCMGTTKKPESMNLGPRDLIDLVLDI
jgi:hypothetical protein